MPRTVEGGLANYRWDYVKSEYRVRYEDGDETEWFIINAPKRARNGATLSCTVSCQHISSLLKTKRLYAVFDDTNGIGTAQDLLDKILSGTGWTRGLTSTFYEKDGTTEKIRSLLSEGKVGAYELIQQLCELFGAVPVFHGNEKTVDLLVKGDRTGLIELTPNKNMPSLVKTEDGSNIVTRLYVEGAYDDTGYLGIESVNPTGLTFILNFDYYKEIGLYTEDHEAATHQYLEDLKSCNDRLYAATAELQKKLTELNAIWGQCNYIVYDGGQLEGTTYTTNATPIASSQGDTIQDGDIVV